VENAWKLYDTSLNLVSEYDPAIYIEVKELVVANLLNLANCAQVCGSYDYVINFCTQCIEYDRFNIDAYQKRGEAFELMGNPTEAKEDYAIVEELRMGGDEEEEGEDAEEGGEGGNESYIKNE